MYNFATETPEVQASVARIIAEARAAAPDLLDFQPESAEQLAALGLPEALALRNCLRGLKIPAQIGYLAMTGTWIHVWVEARHLARARLVAAGFDAGRSVPR